MSVSVTCPADGCERTFENDDLEGAIRSLESHVRGTKDEAHRKDGIWDRINDLRDDDQEDVDDIDQDGNDDDGSGDDPEDSDEYEEQLGGVSGAGDSDGGDGGDDNDDDSSASPPSGLTADRVMLAIGVIAVLVVIYLLWRQRQEDTALEDDTGAETDVDEASADDVQEDVDQAGLI